MPGAIPVVYLTIRKFGAKNAGYPEARNVMVGGATRA